MSTDIAAAESLVAGRSSARLRLGASPSAPPPPLPVAGRFRHVAGCHGNCFQAGGAGFLASSISISCAGTAAGLKVSAATLNAVFACVSGFPAGCLRADIVGPGRSRHSLIAA